MSFAETLFIQLTKTSMCVQTLQSLIIFSRPYLSNARAIGMVVVWLSAELWILQYCNHCNKYCNIFLVPV